MSMNPNTFVKVGIVPQSGPCPNPKKLECELCAVKEYSQVGFTANPFGPCWRFVAGMSRCPVMQFLCGLKREDLHSLGFFT